MNLNIDKKRSPVNPKSPGSLSQQESKSPGSYSQKSAGMSRQGTIRASPHRRKNSSSINLSSSSGGGGRKSPNMLLQDRSPQGHRSPNLMLHDQLRSPSGSSSTDRRSPQGRKSPIGFSQGMNTAISISPTDRKSPIASGSTFYDRKSTSSTIQIQSKRSSIGFSQSFIQSMTSDRDKKSPIQIPPITISNPTETYELSQRMILSQKNEQPSTSQPKDSSPVQEKKEKPSVMREILAFVRKPSKKVTTRTSKFAAAFSRRESDSGSPLLRQSTFSSIPNSSSRTARAAVTKQMSEIGFEPKMSLKFKSVGSKVAQRLRRSEKKDPQQQKKSSGDDISDLESQSSDGGRIDRGIKSINMKTEIPFEMENVHFEKVGEAYSSKHDQIEEEQTCGSPIKIVAKSESILSTLEPKVQNLYNELKKSLEPIFTPKESTPNVNLDGKKIDAEDAGDVNQIKTVHVQCPTFEIEPPSRRASFDPPRSPFLENLRSFSDTDHSRFDSGGESFELVDTDKHNRESSFEDRHSSMDTSFDISKYQSTSYEDQNSSFELVEIENNSHRPNRDFDLRKSSIELVDADTFQKVRHDGRKSSLETHFDLVDNYKLATPSTSGSGTNKNPFISTKKKQLSEPGKMKDYQSSSSNIKSSHYTTPFRSSRSPLSNQTSSNYSSRDSYDSGDPCSYTDSKSPYSDSSRQHFQLPRKSPNENRTFLCTDKRCASIFEPRPLLQQQQPYHQQQHQQHFQQRTSTISPSPHCLGLSDNNYSSGSEFEPPSPRRAASASPKHTFTFRIVLKKVDSSPDAICPSQERNKINRDKQRKRDSRKKRLLETGKSF